LAWGSSPFFWEMPAFWKDSLRCWWKAWAEGSLVASQPASFRALLVSHAPFLLRVDAVAPSRLWPAGGGSELDARLVALLDMVGVLCGSMLDGVMIILYLNGGGLLYRTRVPYPRRVPAGCCWVGMSRRSTIFFGYRELLRATESFDARWPRRT
jgi:hypothetical protein